MISIGMLPVGGFLIGKSKKDKKKETILPKK
jgi:hypothetical protein